MSDFPKSDLEALAMLYTEAQDLAGKTPEEVAMIYFEAYRAIRNHVGKTISAKWFKEETE